MWRIRWFFNWARTCWQFRCIAPWCVGIISHRKPTAAEIAIGQQVARDYGLVNNDDEAHHDKPQLPTEPHAAGA